MKRKTPITEQTRGLVHVYSVCGWKQTEIARELKLCKASVSKIQASLGLSSYTTEPLSPEMRRAALRLLGAGRGVPYISSALCIPSHRIYELKRERGYQTLTGSGRRYGYVVDARKKRVIKRQFRAFAKTLARQFGVREDWMKRFLKGTQ